MTSKSISAPYKELLQEWKKQSLDKVGQLLTKLKLELTQLAFLPTSGTSASKEDLIIARDILEIGAQYSVMRRDIPSFERYFAQLKCYYFDYNNSLPESSLKYKIIGLNLLSLLAQNRVADFHTELELLPAQELQTNVYIRHPVTLEQWLMEGSYNKVFASKDQVPAPTYAFFIDILLDTIRVEIANCIEKAYENISLIEAGRMLYFAQPNQLNEFIVQRKWIVDTPNKRLIFPDNQEKSVKPETRQTIPAESLASKVIEYARELELIV